MGLVAQADVYLMKKLLSSSIDGKSSYEVLFSKPHSLAHLWVIGYLFYASTLPKGDKFTEREQPTFYMG